MPQCKWCLKKGFFLTIQGAGLCKTCYDTIGLEAHERQRVINDSLSIIESSKKLDTQLSRISFILDNCKAMSPYEEKGISILNPPPSQIAARYLGLREELINKHFSSAVEKAVSISKLEGSNKTALSESKKLISKVIDLKKEIPESQSLINIEKKLKEAVHKLQLGIYIEAAEKAKFMDNPKKAIAQYKEALYFLKTDSIDDELQKKEITRIEDEIEDLSSKENSKENKSVVIEVEG